MTDQFNFLVVCVRTLNHLGQFVFPKEVLSDKGFVSKDGCDGKRAMRVYCPWDIPTSKQAQQTQAWQVQYFFEIEPILDNAAAKRLFYRNNESIRSSEKKCRVPCTKT
jgi:hypothetical protein